VAVATAKPQIGLVMKTLTNPFFVEMEKGARRAEKELGVNLIVKAATQETSIEQQIQLVDDLIAAKVAAIVIAPGDSQSLVPVLKKAADAGIKIVNIDNKLDAAAVKQAGFGPVPFVSVDNEQAAYNATKLLADGRESSEAAIFEGIRGADNARLRLAGAQRGFATNPAIKVVASESANWKIDEAYALAGKVFKQHPKISLVFAANDMMALGVVKYLKEHQRSDVTIASIDALPDAVDAVRAKTLAVTVDQQAAEQGYKGVQLATRLLQGETVPDVTMVETRLITQDNVQ
jgi:ribose transport system substrate-binding protein